MSYAKAMIFVLEEGEEKDIKSLFSVSYEGMVCWFLLVLLFVCLFLNLGLS